MMICRSRFNIYLMCLLAVVFAGGCKTQRLSTLRLHQEINQNAGNRVEAITVHRDPLVTMHIDSLPFLTEAYVKSAKVVDVVGGHALSIQFDRQGSWLLEQYTSALRGKRIAIFVQFSTPPKNKLNQGRWMAAVYIQERTTNGLLVFTPNATREEAELIAEGLRNVAKKEGKLEGDR